MNKNFLTGSPPTYFEKYNEPKILDTIHNNMALVQPFAEIIDEALEILSCNNGPFGQQKNHAVMEE